MRCLTLAKALKENGANIEFICRKHEGSITNKIRLSGFNVFELEEHVEKKYDKKLLHSHWLGATQQQDSKDCIRILQQTKVDWLIVDHYGIDEDWEKNLTSCCDKLMVIDDLADRKHECDILLDQTFGRQRLDYKNFVLESCTMLLGTQYALLRPEFSQWREYSLKRRQKSQFKQLLINMGGVDVNNITKEILNEISKCDLPNDINIVIIMGSTAPHINSIEVMVRNFPYHVEVRADVHNMAEIMANSDLAIGATGATTWERCCLGLPTIQLVVAENQAFSAKNLGKENIGRLIKDIQELGGLLDGMNKWMQKSGQSAAKICDGLGVFRVLNAMERTSKI
jgi:UDP-2,4-diacetamido-2,4,6-trideoxy-beta-L-altropyranose hydrolase